MQLSADLPYGFEAVRGYIESRGNARLLVNVTKEADAAYFAEKGLVIAPKISDSWPVGTCARCRGVVHNVPFVKAGQEYCSQECRDGLSAKNRSTKEADRQMARQQAKWDKLAAKRALKTGNLPTGWLWCAYESCRTPFRPARSTTICCSPRCKYRYQQAQPDLSSAVAA